MGHLSLGLEEGDIALFIFSPVSLFSLRSVMNLSLLIKRSIACQRWQFETAPLYSEINIFISCAASPLSKVLSVVLAIQIFLIMIADGSKLGLISAKGCSNHRLYSLCICFSVDLCLFAYFSVLIVCFCLFCVWCMLVLGYGHLLLWLSFICSSDFSMEISVSAVPATSDGSKSGCFLNSWTELLKFELNFYSCLWTEYLILDLFLFLVLWTFNAIFITW